MTVIGIFVAFMMEWSLLNPSAQASDSSCSISS